MLIYAYYNKELDHMFTEHDTDYLHKMLWRLDNPQLAEGWEYQTEEGRKITYWKTPERTYGTEEQE